MQQRSLRHNLQVESFRLLCSDQLHCRPYFQSVARRVFVNGRRQDRPEKFRLLHGTPNPSPMRDACLRFHRALVTGRFLEFTKVSVSDAGGFAQAGVTRFDPTAAVSTPFENGNANHFNHSRLACVWLTHSCNKNERCDAMFRALAMPSR
jgi:hypothetical protein